MMPFLVRAVERPGEFYLTWRSVKRVLRYERVMGEQFPIPVMFTEADDRVEVRTYTNEQERKRLMEYIQLEMERSVQ